MRFSFAGLILACTLSTANAYAANATPAPAFAPERSVDTAHSRAMFSVTHIYVAKVTGNVPILSAVLALPPGSAIPRRISAVLDPKHIDTHDSDRDESLQGPDWFDVKRFPAWSFTSTAVTQASSKAFNAEGMLTIHGTAQPVTLHVNIVRGLPDPVYHAEATIHRHAFGMRITPVDGMIGDDLDLTLDITLR